MAAEGFRLNHGSNVYVIRACYNEDGADLLALGGEHSVEVYQISTSSAKRLAAFHIGTRITALAWSPRSLSPSRSDEWLIELAAASIDFGLHLLTRSSTSSENIFPFGGGLSGHHGKINDICFCGGRDLDSARYVATVSDDKMLMVWDLIPPQNTTSRVSSPTTPSALEDATPSAPRAQPTAYAIAFAHALTTVASHPSSSREFLVSDCRGSVYLTDWRTNPDQTEQGSWRGSTLLELIEPKALSSALMAASSQWSGFSAWHRDSADIMGLSCGSRFAIWDLSKLRGGKPLYSGNSFADGGRFFRWCPTNPDYFAIAAHSNSKGAVIHLHNVGHVQAQPSVINVAPKPHSVRDFDFVALHGRVVLAVGFGHQVAVLFLD